MHRQTTAKRREPSAHPPIGSPSSRNTFPTFRELFDDDARATAGPPRGLQPGECQSRSGQRCRLCAAVSLEYVTERAIKDRVLQKFWRMIGGDAPLRELVASPLERGYRTVTKRKVISVHGRPRLGLIDPSDSGPPAPFEVLHCAIEPPEHELLYRRAALELERPSVASLAGALRYVVIRGASEEVSVILNVGAITAAVSREANTLSKALGRTGVRLGGVFLYEDTSRGGYYLGSKDPGARARVRKIFGSSELRHQVSGHRFLYSPLTFSQVNHSILEPLVQSAATLLSPAPDSRLLDLYCGYGLFSISLAGGFQAVTGVEVSPDAVAAASANAKRLKIANAKFLRSDISAASVARLFTRNDHRDLVLLDPPRNGTAAGVIEYIAARRPSKILHLFCNLDILPAELARWKSGGYEQVAAVPFDMFPGIPAVEIMVLLHPKG